MADAELPRAYEAGIPHEQQPPVPMNAVLLIETAGMLQGRPVHVDTIYGRTETGICEGQGSLAAPEDSSAAEGALKLSYDRRTVHIPGQVITGMQELRPDLQVVERPPSEAS